MHFSNIPPQWQEDDEFRNVCHKFGEVISVSLATSKRSRLLSINCQLQAVMCCDVSCLCSHGFRFGVIQVFSYSDPLSHSHSHSLPPPHTVTIALTLMSTHTTALTFALTFTVWSGQARQYWPSACKNPHTKPSHRRIRTSAYAHTHMHSTLHSA